MGKPFEDVTRLQPSFERKAMRIPGVLSVGIGEAPDGQQFGFYVLVKSVAAARKLPGTFHSVDVVAEIVSTPRVHAKRSKA